MEVNRHTSRKIGPAKIHFDHDDKKVVNMYHRHYRKAYHDEGEVLFLNENGKKLNSTDCWVLFSKHLLEYVGFTGNDFSLNV